MSAHSVRLRPATEADRFLLRRWLADPHVVAWWGSRTAADAEIAMAFDSAYAMPRIVLEGDEPVGYAHALPVGDHGGAVRAALPAGSYDADVFIARPSLRGKGLGAQALAQLRDELFSTTLALGLGVVVSIRNESAVRAIEKVGFRWRAVVDDRLLGRCWLLRADR